MRSSSKTSSGSPKWFTPRVANGPDPSLDYSVETFVAALLAELFKLSVNLAFDTQLFCGPFEEGYELRPGQMAFDVERLGDAVVTGNTEDSDGCLLYTSDAADE